MHQVELFRRYLLKCGHSGFPKLEKDLLFCIEVIKFRVSIFNWSLTWNVVPVVPGKSMCKEKVTYMIYQFGVYIVYSIKCIYIYIYIYIRTCNYENNVPSQLSPQWLFGISCTWAHDVQTNRVLNKH